MKVAFFETEPREKGILSKELHGYQMTFYSGKLSPLSDFENLKEVEVISPFIYSEITKEVLDKLPKLKFITTRSTGFDHIDLKACKERRIIVANIPSYGENTVAEHTFALILALSRKIIPSVEKTRLGNFGIEDLRGFDLKDKTLGIIGLGKIGAHVARIAYGFEMKILGYDPYPNKELTDKFSVDFTSLEQLLKQSDLITLHLPLNSRTEHIINETNIKQIKKGVYIINTSRGGLIDPIVLIKALNDNSITGLALDVLEEETHIKEELEVLSPNFSKEKLLVNAVNNILLKDPKVIVTPHNAFNSREALDRIVHTTIENIKNYTKKSPINLVKTI